MNEENDEDAAAAFLLRLLNLDFFAFIIRRQQQRLKPFFFLFPVRVNFTSLFKQARQLGLVIAAVYLSAYI